MKKENHKIVESKFWSGPNDDNLNGEFELYGEYYPFFKFAKKLRRQTLDDILKQLK